MAPTELCEKDERKETERERERERERESESVSVRHISGAISPTFPSIAGAQQTRRPIESNPKIGLPTRYNPKTVKTGRFKRKRRRLVGWLLWCRVGPACSCWCQGRTCPNKRPKTRRRHANVLFPSFFFHFFLLVASSGSFSFTPFRSAAASFSIQASFLITDKCFFSSFQRVLPGFFRISIKKTFPWFVGFGSVSSLFLLDSISLS